MKKLIFAVLVLTLVSGCGKMNRVVANYTGHSKECVDGVQYLQFPSGATVQLGLDGKPVACK